MNISHHFQWELGRLLDWRILLLRLTVSLHDSPSLIFGHHVSTAALRCQRNPLGLLHGVPSTSSNIPDPPQLHVKWERTPFDKIGLLPLGRNEEESYSYYGKYKQVLSTNQHISCALPRRSGDSFLLLGLCGSAPCSRRILTFSSSPTWTAKVKAVSPFLPFSSKSGWLETVDYMIIGHFKTKWKACMSETQ